MSNDLKLGQLVTDPNAQRDAIHIAVVPVTAAEQLLPGARVIMRAGKAELCEPEYSHVGVVDPFLLAPVTKGQRFWLFLNPGSITSLRHHWSHPAFAEEVNEKLSTTEVVKEVISSIPDPAVVGYTYDNTGRRSYGTVPAHWRSEQVLGLCREIRNAANSDDDSYDSTRLAVLADALEEAGCNDQPLIELFRKKYTRSFEALRLVSLLESETTIAAVRWLSDYADELRMNLTGLLEVIDDFERKWTGSKGHWRDQFCLSFDTPDMVYHSAEEFWRNWEIVTGRKCRDNNAIPFRCAC